MAVNPYRNRQPAVLIRQGVRVGPKDPLAPISKRPPEIIQPFRVLLRGGTAAGPFDEAFQSISHQRPGPVAAGRGRMRPLGFPRRIDPKESRPRRFGWATRGLKPDRKRATRSAWKAPTVSDPLHEELDLKRVEAEDLYEAMDELTEANRPSRRAP